MLDPEAVRHGRVRGRYFRENFAQGGIDLVQIIPERVTNADAAIAASGRPVGRIELAFAPPDADWLGRWRAELRRLRAPALRGWRHEVVCTDDGEGVNAELVDRRLGALGERPVDHGQRGMFGRGPRPGDNNGGSDRDRDRGRSFFGQPSPEADALQIKPSNGNGKGH